MRKSENKSNLEYNVKGFLIEETRTQEVTQNIWERSSLNEETRTWKATQKIYNKFLKCAK